MISKDQIEQLQSGTVLDSEGSKIGSVMSVYFDDDTGEPDWVTVKTGLFGGSEPFVPLAQARLDGSDVRIPYDKEKVKGAPRVDAEQHLDIEQEHDLYAYYGLEYGDADDADADELDRGERFADASGDQLRGTGQRDSDTSGTSADDAMTRSEERLKVGTQRHEAGRVRLRKYVVTEQETVTVPVTREEVRIEREPITEANRGDATSGSQISEDEHEVILHEERPTLDKEAVPVERVRLTTDEVTEDVQISEEVRKERIESEGAFQERDR